eukprot:TRINITY_DN8882_c0_g1_i1.p1 TRINITY_DN8882_c0_g1~~TRINITY_DN8882_c0_g1_i1.p1  ORF type:complete len:172 (-),score=28.20 TRINITY_DN8882_c0_g1_i1:142-657(-)
MAGKELKASGKGRRWGFELEGDANAPDPFGLGKVFHSEEESRGVRSERSILDLKRKKMWEQAQGPTKDIIFPLIMMYLTGGLNIVTIMIVFGFMFSSIRNVMNTNEVFSKFRELQSETLLPKIVYMSLSSVPFMMAIYKGYNLGLAPTDADWSINLPVREFQEHSFGSIVT